MTTELTPETLKLALDQDLMVKMLRELHTDWLDHGRYTKPDGHDAMVPKEHWVLARLAADRAALAEARRLLDMLEYDKDGLPEAWPSEGLVKAALAASGEEKS